MLLGLVAVAMSFSSLPAAEPEIKIGMYQTMFRDITPEMLTAIAKPLRSIIEKTVGLTGDAELVPNAAELAQKLDDRKLQIGVFHGYEFAWHKQKHPDLVPLMLAVPHGGKLQALVVVNKDNTATSLADLENQCVVIPKMTKAHCELFLNDLRVKLPSTTAKPVFKKNLVTEEALNDLAAGNIDAVVVDAGAYAAYAKFTPGNASVLKVLCKSVTFPYAVLAARKDGLSETQKCKVVSCLSTAHENAHGKPLMMLWGLKSFESVPDDYESELTTILKTYPAPKSVEVIPTSLKKD